LSVINISIQIGVDSVVILITYKVKAVTPFFKKRVVPKMLTSLLNHPIITVETGLYQQYQQHTQHEIITYYYSRNGFNPTISTH